MVKNYTVMSSGNLNSLNICIANFYLFVIQMVCYSDAQYHGSGQGIWIVDQYSNDGLNTSQLTKWWSEYRITMVPGIWIANHSKSEQIPLIWIPNYFAIQIPCIKQVTDTVRMEIHDGQLLDFSMSGLHFIKLAHR